MTTLTPIKKVLTFETDKPEEAYELIKEALRDSTFQWTRINRNETGTKFTVTSEFSFQPDSY